MSLVDQQLLAVGKAGRPIDMTNTRALDDKVDFPLSSQTAAFDEPIFDQFYDMDNQDTVAPSPKRVRSTNNIPELPPKSALRASRMLDVHGLKLGGAVEAAELDQAATPHDVYLSSEEDASSDADDFSDYDYDSSVEDPTSPTERSSHEDTARVVSVVFAGKPSIVDLPATRKRPLSNSSLGTTSRTRRLSVLAKPPPTTTTPATMEVRPTTPASTTSSRYSRKDDTTSNRKSMFLSDILNRKKPPFLSIDPYANGSTYTLDIPKALDSLEGESQSARTPRTPTALLKGVTRSFSLARKRSRPNLSSAQAAVPRLDTSFTTTSNPNRASVQTPATAPPQVDEQQQQQQRPKTPMTPITYTDILRAVKKNAIVMGAASPPSDILSPTSPGPAVARRGILSGLSARRRSVKLTGKA
ncbi:hypothetical protein C8A00DRAFT_12599 [Chaetomidium leptoderma]|uniref:Uncharacterized protein n=1 Tax=Chaetomidium leptoderma TaxID=669021 RepID=A0AAN6VSI8_9PEZI|nr:hypothetical protein C8A00DRAFT_12599 [Chaetomidium leptoderma]